MVFELYVLIELSNVVIIRILVGFNRKLGRIDAEFAVLPLSSFPVSSSPLSVFHSLSISISVYALIVTGYFFVIYNDRLLNSV